MKDDPRSCECNKLCNCLKKPEKIQDFNGVLTLELTILVRCSNQLSYEATNVGSRSIITVGSYVPVKEMGVIYFIYIIHSHELVTIIS